MATFSFTTCTAVGNTSPRCTSSWLAQTLVRPSCVSTWREPPRAYDSFKRLPRPDHLYVDPAGKCLFDKKHVYYGQRVNKTAAATSLKKKKAQKKVEKRFDKQTERQGTPSAVKFQDKAPVDGPVIKHAEQETQPAEKTSNSPYGEWSLTVWGCVVTLPGCSIARPDTEEPRIGSISSFEDGFHTRPSIRLPVPDHIKGILVDDWENVTRNNQLVPLPHPHPVDQIINDYLEYERPSRDPESPHVDILEETMAGLKEYFEKSLSRILLYRFERPQYHEIRKEWEKTGENGPKSVCDTYGAEHLCRLIVSLPELVAQTTMDQQSVSRLREEISKFTVWLGKNATKYFVSEYETPAQEYIDRARNI
ncbi:MRG15 protein [Verticillium dahliae]|nr:MRG15 protein [Verticillium dahliae]